MKYRLGVGIMLLNKNNKVFVAKRIDNTKHWQMPQGGINENETPYIAALRELKEEIGTNSIQIICESKTWYSYEIPKNIRIQTLKKWPKNQIGQKQKWFLAKLQGADNEINLNYSSYPEFSEWQWQDIDNIVINVVDFKKELYKKVLEEFSRYIF